MASFGGEFARRVAVARGGALVGVPPREVAGLVLLGTRGSDWDGAALDRDAAGRARDGEADRGTATGLRVGAPRLTTGERVGLAALEAGGSERVGTVIADADRGAPRVRAAGRLDV